MRQGSVYLAALLDWATRRVLAWRLSNSMTVDFCLDALEAAIRDYGPPGILNTDKGSQFTDTAFVGLVQAHGIRLSMDGRGAWRATSPLTTRAGPIRPLTARPPIWSILPLRPQRDA